MKLILTYLLSFFIYLSNLAQSQEPTTQYTFRKIDLKNAAQQFDETIKKLVTNNFEEHKYMQAAVTEVDGDTYHWFYAFLDSDRGRMKVKHLFTKQTKESLLDWEISYQEQSYKYIYNLYQFSKSSLFFIDQVVYLKIYERIYSDFEDRANLHFFSLKPDSVRELGFIGLRDMDNPSDERRDLYESRVGVLKSTNHTVEFTIKMKMYLTTGSAEIISSEYVLSSDGLQHKSTKRLEFFITEKEAKEKLNQIFEQYYSPKWKKRISEPQGNRNRARAFLSMFQELKFLRSDFAPAYYNEACMFGILGSTKFALRSLKRAFELDKSYKTKALRDPDLKAVRELPEFRNLIDK